MSTILGAPPVLGPPGPGGACPKAPCRSQGAGVVIHDPLANGDVPVKQGESRKTRILAGAAGAAGLLLLVASCVALRVALRSGSGGDSTSLVPATPTAQPTATAQAAGLQRALRSTSGGSKGAAAVLAGIDAPAPTPLSTTTTASAFGSSGSSSGSGSGSELDAGRAADSPNIVFILADDLGYSDVCYNGQRFYETPNIDALARDGIIFSDFYSGGANCAPSRACINTGMYTPRHKLYTPSGGSKGDVRSMRFAVPINDRVHKYDPFYNTLELVTKVNVRDSNGANLSHPPTALGFDGAHTSIAEVLGTAGYVSGRFGKWHLGEDLQGFTVSSADGTEGATSIGYSFYGNIDVAENLTDAAVAFIEQNKKRPFFLYVGHWDVHAPLNARAEVIAKYTKKARDLHRQRLEMEPDLRGHAGRSGHIRRPHPSEDQASGLGEQHAVHLHLGQRRYLVRHHQPPAPWLQGYLL